MATLTTGTSFSNSAANGYVVADGFSGPAGAAASFPNGTSSSGTISGPVAATTLSASGAVSGAGFTSYLASPPAIGGTAAAAGSFTNLTLTQEATSAPAPTIASAATIAPVTRIAFVSGTTQINTITAPTPMAATGGVLTLVPTGLWTTGTTGNIAIGSTAVVDKALTLVYDATAAKWYPSY